ncbi:hypothetical protein BDA99DRAFT_517111 [Phascolomyces articulosus]|uniref:Zn(2)-C6 fungal-type domain-containing protein n=1 Tax=Phascolomyces articulosus TaxID=60185 RepID=A0AAD5PBL9_9FUNG|nr:hypothetical protein BDA99DRAFT_517111 [Phascolomyces articulosus]
MISKGKNVPCEGCRERKKKCSSGQPCERCKRLGIECHYLKPATPPDLNYVDMVNSHELEANVNELEHLMIDMEEQMRRLQQMPPVRDRNLSSSLSYPISRPLISKRQSSADELPAMSSNCSSSSGSTVSSPNTTTESTPPPQSMEVTVIKRRKPQKLIQQQPTITTNWQLKIGKHGLCIETNILSYDDLLHQIRAFGFINTADEDPTLPMFKQPSNPIPPTLHRYILNTPVRRAHFQAIKKCITHNEQQKQQFDLSTLSTSPSSSGASTPRCEENSEDKINIINDGVLHFKQESSQQITLKLLDAFFSCQFYHNICLHRGTFYSLFVDQDDPDSSPVVCAMAAAILTMRCHHILDIIPYSQQMGVHSYFIVRAKYLLANVFDDITLEPYLTYLFMALYYINLQRPNDSIRYFEQCIRIRHLLVDEYMPKKWGATHTNEQELFKRSQKILFTLAMRIDFFHNRRGIIVRSMDKTRQSSCSLMKELQRHVAREDCLPTPFPDEDAKISRAMRQDNYSNRMHRVLNPYLDFTRFTRDPVPLQMLVKTEAALNEFYFKDLPPEFRLSLSIFENNLSDVEFQRRLAGDVNCDAASIMVAIRYYQAVISVHEPFMPTLPAEYNLKNANKNGPGMLSILSTDEESSACEIYNEQERSVHTLRALEMCYRSAIILVRLFEYLIVTLDTCTDMLMPCLLTAWDIHVRNACLGLTDPEEAQKHVPVRVVKTSREYVLRCVDIVRKGYHYNAGDRGLWEHYQSVENELLKAMFATRPYTAQY